MSTRESRRALEFQEEYADAGLENIAQSLSLLTEWLWEGKGDPDDDVMQAEALVQEYVRSSAKS